MSQNISSQDIVWSDPLRSTHFSHWLTSIVPSQGLHIQTLRLASADASFRRYFRIDSKQGSRIIMDAPPDKENSQPFVKVADMLHKAQVHAPKVLAWDASLGFMLLTDLGTQTMMQVINRDNAQANLPLYLQAVEALIAWQLASQPDVLPLYDEALLRRELALFPDWYLAKHHRISVEGEVRQTLNEAFTHIINHNLAWPSVYVHRDFMPRNLMVSDTGQLGVIDFQDAVYGPITYDIASLMRDAFISWDDDFCQHITLHYWNNALKAGLPVGFDFDKFDSGVRWMGLQRHLKVAGIFARLTLRDGKPLYLADTPRFIGYIRATCVQYPELKPLLQLVDRIESQNIT